jgi:hypothetical protein
MHTPLGLDLLPKLEEEARERQAEHGAAPSRPAQNNPSDPGRSDEKAAAMGGSGGEGPTNPSSPGPGSALGDAARWTLSDRRGKCGVPADTC